MLFNSFDFLIFFPVVAGVYFFIPHRFRWVWLLAASCYFYMAFIPAYILILVFTIVIDYFAGLLIAKSTGKNRKLFLIASIIANVGVLAIFKYYNFFIGNLNELDSFLHWNYSLSTLSWILPIGLSFHTFQAMSYTIEVYRGNYPAERHFGIYALYVLFFPQLVAGPIERPQHLLPQFHAPQKFDLVRMSGGLRLMLWGFFKKIVIADNCGVIVDHVFNYPTQFTGVPLIVGSVLFVFQLYADFSGYTDIARGSAKVLGIQLMKNFNLPYLATSIADFWRRWHISLSTWFKDYLYIPLGGSRAGLIKHCRNLIIVFLISGLWHGANWTYVIWGGIHGVLLSLEAMWKWALERTAKNVPSPSQRGGWGGVSLLKVPLTFILVALAFIFFRAKTLTDAWYILTHLPLFNRPIFSAAADGLGWWNELGVTPMRLLLIALFICIMGVIEYHEQKQNELGDSLTPRSPWVRWGAYQALILIIFFFGYFGEQPFIYFQF